MNGLKIKYIIPLVLIILFVIYQVLLSFTIVPYFMGGEDIGVLLLLLVAVFLFLLAGTVEKIARAVLNVEENIEIKTNRDLFDDFPIVENIQDNQTCKFLIGIQNYFKNAHTMEEVLNRLLVMSMKVTQSARASIMLHDRKKDELYIYKTLGWGSTEIRLVKNIRSKPGEGIAGRVFIDERPLIVNNNTMGEEYELKEKYESKSFISFPIHTGEKTLGVLNLTEKKTASYTSSEVDVLKFIGNEVSIRLEGIGIL